MAEHPYRFLGRRTFVQYLALIGLGARTLLRPRDAHAAAEGSETAGWPAMTYRPLGRTGWNASRLVMGCGATLMFRRKDALLQAAYDAGVNVFDVGYRGYYRNAEEHLAPFLQKVRDKIFLISKAPADVEAEPDQEVTPAQAKGAAARWRERLDQSLAELRVDHVDAYYLMAAHNPSLIRSDEIQQAFEAAKQAGKVSHLGLSTHRNAEKVLLAAADTGRYGLAMIAITPGGWYDWESKGILEGAKPMVELRPVLEQARRAGMGLVGMKAGRHLAGLPFVGWFDKPEAFQPFYPKALLEARLSTFQRSYAFVLEHGLDVVNADMGSLEQLRENVAAAATSGSYFA